MIVMSEIKNCPNCGNEFVCNVNDISNCQCNQITISTATQQYLLTKNWDCICVHCLRKIDDSIRQKL